MYVPISVWLKIKENGVKALFLSVNVSVHVCVYPCMHENQENPYKGSFSTLGMYVSMHVLCMIEKPLPFRVCVYVCVYVSYDMHRKRKRHGKSLSLYVCIIYIYIYMCVCVCVCICLYICLYV